MAGVNIRRCPTEIHLGADKAKMCSSFVRFANVNVQGYEFVPVRLMS